MLNKTNESDKKFLLYLKRLHNKSVEFCLHERHSYR